MVVWIGLSLRTGSIEKTFFHFVESSHTPRSWFILSFCRKKILNKNFLCSKSTNKNKRNSNLSLNLLTRMNSRALKTILKSRFRKSTILKKYSKIEESKDFCSWNWPYHSVVSKCSPNHWNCLAMNGLTRFISEDWVW